MYCGNTQTRGRARRRAAAARGPGSTSSRMRHLVSATVLALSVVGLVVGGAASGQVPPNAPHYFGPYPNWANSPLTLPDATVNTIGNGSPARRPRRRWEQTAPSPGSRSRTAATGYGQVKVEITGAGTGATADGEIIKKGAVIDIAVTTGGQRLHGAHRDHQRQRKRQRRHGDGLRRSRRRRRCPTSGAATRSRRWTSTCRTTRTASRRRATPCASRRTVPGRRDGEPARRHRRRRRRPRAPATRPRPASRSCNGTQFDPIPFVEPFTEAIATATLDDPVGRHGHVRVRLHVGTGRYLQRHRRRHAGRGATGDRHDRRRSVTAAITAKKPGSGYVTPGRDQEVRRHLAGPRRGRGEQPRPVHPGRRARYDDVPGRRLLRDRCRAVPRADELQPARRGNAAARLRPAVDQRRARRHVPLVQRQPRPCGRRPTPITRSWVSTSRTTLARRSSPRRTGRSGSSSTTCCRQGAEGDLFLPVDSS